MRAIFGARSWPWIVEGPAAEAAADWKKKAQSLLDARSRPRRMAAQA